MSLMQYSEVLKHAYGIQLKPEHEHLTNIFFSGAAHHQARMAECPDEAKEHRFHGIRFMAHLRHLFTTVYRHGEFRYAEDKTLRTMDERESWHPDRFVWPDPDMFSQCKPDPDFLAGTAHPFDQYLRNLDPPKPSSGVTEAGFVKLLGTAGKA
ncbi:MAG: hypothetical protein A2603_09405 [Bdellovibrionales bacterium RIFOXYD1_FULL_55_31]|nr:MAG: hypothetical protein A2603_09405 [Bdellovibrionales bacterium RIFOXYD1_FULL_55_31]